VGAYSIEVLSEVEVDDQLKKLISFDYPLGGTFE